MLQADFVHPSTGLCDLILVKRQKKDLRIKLITSEQNVDFITLHVSANCFTEWVKSGIPLGHQLEEAHRLSYSPIFNKETILEESNLHYNTGSILSLSIDLKRCSTSKVQT